MGTDKRDMSDNECMGGHGGVQEGLCKWLYEVRDVIMHTERMHPPEPAPLVALRQRASYPSW